MLCLQGFFLSFIIFYFSAAAAATGQLLGAVCESVFCLQNGSRLTHICAHVKKIAQGNYAPCVRCVSIKCEV